MCFIAEFKKEKKKHTATKGIICWKVLRREGVVYTSLYYQKFVWKFDKTYKQRLQKSVEDKTLHVNKGFHSYINKESANVDMFRKGVVIVKCKIPKGAKYYKNGYEYVSSKIKVICVIQQP